MTVARGCRIVAFIHIISASSKFPNKDSCVMYNKVETRTFLIFLLLVTIGFVLLLKPFFGTVFWACAIAIIFAPLQDRLLKRWPKRKNQAALVTLLLCTVIVVLPMIFVVMSVVSEGVALYDKLQSGEINPAGYIESM